MGFALMKGVAMSANAAAGINIGFTDADKQKAQAAAKELKGAAAIPVVYQSNTEAAEKGDYIFLAVKPQILAGVLAEISPVVRKRMAAGNAPALVSMAAGWSIEKVQAAVADNAPVARIMPNTPALVSKGLIALAVSPQVSGEKAAELETMLKGAGAVDRVDEKYLNAVTGLSGSGPAFAYLFIEALADGGVLAGLPRDKALQYAAQTVFGSAAMITETGKHPGELKDMVCSPGGTTIAGVTALESGAFRSTVIKAVEAAWHRATELA